ncbi:MAG: chemotaxis protein CheD [Anaerolineae bacterium]|nr:chemotaxis protein CheD [Anaerolineae bacterium]
MANSIAIGLAELKVSRNPDDVLVAFGLGSCIGVGMYDPAVRVGGLLHAVLPFNSDTKELSPKYVDTGIALLLDELTKVGAVKNRLITKVAGGANMLNVSSLSSSFDIGNRNIEAMHATLAKLGIKPKSEEVGGKIGRTVRLYIATGKMTLRMMGEQEREF